MLPEGAMRVGVVGYVGWIALALPACSSNAGPDPHEPVVSGSYATQNAGEYQYLEFSDATHYLLWRNQPCGDSSSGEACLEGGTYVLTADTLMLTDAPTGAVAAIPFKQVPATSESGVTTQSLSSPTGASLVEGNIVSAFELTTPTGQSQLLQTVAAPGYSTCRGLGGYCSPSAPLFPTPVLPEGDADCVEQYGWGKCYGLSS